jgi:hypothetical protein
MKRLLEVASGVGRSVCLSPISCALCRCSQVLGNGTLLQNAATERCYRTLLQNAATERCYGTLLTNSLGQLTSSARPTLPGIRPDGYVFRAAVTRF